MKDTNNGETIFSRFPRLEKAWYNGRGDHEFDIRGIWAGGKILHVSDCCITNPSTRTCLSWLSHTDYMKLTPNYLSAQILQLL